MSVPLTQALGAGFLLFSFHTSIKSTADAAPQVWRAVGYSVAVSRHQRGKVPLIETPHCSRFRPQSVGAADPASIAHQVVGTGQFPGNPKQQNHLLR